MGSEVVVTYKRKRLFSRSDHSYTNLHSEVSKAKTSEDIREHVGPVEEYMLQNKDPEVGISNQYSDDLVEENVLQCGNCDSQSEKLSSMKPGSDCADKCKETDQSSLETNKLDKDKADSLCGNLVTKRQLPATLITFCRRSKRSKSVAPGVSCSVDLKEDNAKLKTPSIDNEERRPTEDIAKSSSFPAPAPAVAMAVHTDNLSTTAKQESCEDVKSRRMLSEVSEKRESQLSLGLSVSPYGPRDIDCNRPPPDCGSDESHPLEPSKVPHDYVGSTSKLKEKMPALQILQDSHMKASRVKGKSIMDPQPVLTGTSSRNNCMQLFPEKLEKVDPFWAASFHPPNFHGLSLQPEQTVDNRAFYSPSYQWPYVQPQPRESFHDFLQPKPDPTQSFSRQKMMLDSILTRARAARGNRSSFLDKFDPPTTWSEEELDSLWIGVRRHGRGNWDAILADRRLHFPPWKTARDLADRWQLEQAQLFCSKPIPQLKTGPLQRSGAKTGPCWPSSSYGYLANGWPGPLHPSLGDESSSSAGPMTGGLPHWLRAAVEVSPRQFDLTPNVGSSVGPSGLGRPGFEFRPWSISGQRTEPHNAVGRCGKMQANERSVEKEDELIIIPSDASSEETISDDRNGRC